MLIVIPTYKRNDCLRAVLHSLVLCRTENIPEPIRVVVVCNYPPAASEVKAIVERHETDCRFAWDVLYRAETLPPVDNWYSAVFSRALPDEVVFINSDDDLLTPQSLEIRYREVVRGSGDLLLAQQGATVFFSERAERVLCLGEPTVTSSAVAVVLNVGDLAAYAPQHLSNHCYRNTLALRRAFETAMSWCDALDWLDRNNRTINFPLILALALCHGDGRVLGIAAPLFIRGMEVEEVVSSKYGVPGWNHGFVHLCALLIMSNSDLETEPGLDRLRTDYLSTYVSWFPTYFFDRRLSIGAVLETQHRAGLKWRSLLSTSVLAGGGLLLSDALGLRGRRLRRRARNESVRTDAFLETLARG